MCSSLMSNLINLPQVFKALLRLKDEEIDESRHEGLIIEEDTISSAAAPPQVDCPCSERKTILAVDDNCFNLLALEIVIEQELHMEADKALNGSEACEKVLERIRDIQQRPCMCGNPAGNRNY